ncbi:hypothetical protein JOQ06_023913 [Pogonophryne albipinna]|uniref:Uncharacterized protein n=1 Tax=Pogonophryne albipinna TaxID=1090488 RepID=A0AAD6BQ79_9TELE|nr:hypothetical protein JOQ06_023913 [Pogonophryne albipinna]
MVNKKGNWSLTSSREIIIMGSSNIARLPFINDKRIQVDSYPGAKLSHAVHIIKYKTPTSPDTRHERVPVGTGGTADPGAQASSKGDNYNVRRNHVGLSIIYPVLLNMANNTLSANESDLAAIRSFKNTVRKELITRFKLLSRLLAESIPITACILDPRFKHLKFLPDDVREETQARLTQLVREDGEVEQPGATGEEETTLEWSWRKKVAQRRDRRVTLNSCLELISRAARKHGSTVARMSYGITASRHPYPHKG